MEKKIKELLSDPKVLYTGALICFVLLVGACLDLNKAIKHNAALPDPVDPNYKIILDDGISVEEFKYNLFMKGIQEDLDRGTSAEAIILKFKYFYGIELR